MTRTQLVTWGEELGRALVAPRLVTIAGELGAGKTTLVQAIARGYGVTEAVTSPTFALVHVYRAARSDVYLRGLLSAEMAIPATIDWNGLAPPCAIARNSSAR